MELKEQAGDQDLFDVMNREKRKKKRMAKKAEKSSRKLEKPTDVFDFINAKLLKGKKGKSTHLFFEDFEKIMKLERSRPNYDKSYIRCEKFFENLIERSDQGFRPWLRFREYPRTEARNEE